MSRISVATHQTLPALRSSSARTACSSLGERVSSLGRSLPSRDILSLTVKVASES